MPFPLLVKPKPLIGSLQVGRNDINVIVTDQPCRRPSDGRPDGPDRAQITLARIVESETMPDDGRTDSVDQQRPNPDRCALNVESIGRFQVDWRDASH